MGTPFFPLSLPRRSRHHCRRRSPRRGRGRDRGRGRRRGRRRRRHRRRRCHSLFLLPPPSPPLDRPLFSRCPSRESAFDRPEFFSPLESGALRAISRLVAGWSSPRKTPRKIVRSICLRSSGPKRTSERERHGYIAESSEREAKVPTERIREMERERERRREREREGESDHWYLPGVGGRGLRKRGRGSRGGGGPRESNTSMCNASCAYIPVSVAVWLCAGGRPWP